MKIGVIVDSYIGRSVDVRVYWDIGGELVSDFDVGVGINGDWEVELRDWRWSYFWEWQKCC